MRDDDDRDAATGGQATPPDAADDGNPDAAAGVGARSGYGIDTGEENEGYPDGSLAGGAASHSKDGASAGRPVDTEHIA